MITLTTLAADLRRIMATAAPSWPLHGEGYGDRQVLTVTRADLRLLEQAVRVLEASDKAEQ